MGHTLEVGLIVTSLTRLAKVCLGVARHIELRAVISIVLLVRFAPDRWYDRVVWRLAAHDEGTVADAGNEGPRLGVRKTRWMVITVYRLAIDNEWRGCKIVARG